jgi:hypothetical protein
MPPGRALGARSLGDGGSRLHDAVTPDASHFIFEPFQSKVNAGNAPRPVPPTCGECPKIRKPNIP